jgi:hypothetical protein
MSVIGVQLFDFEPQAEVLLRARHPGQNSITSR